jgi:hypothetical protein
MKAIILKHLKEYTKEMEGYSYCGSNPGVSEDDYEEISDKIIKDYVEYNTAIKNNLKFLFDDLNDNISILSNNVYYDVPTLSKRELTILSNSLESLFYDSDQMTQEEIITIVNDMNKEFKKYQ